MPPKNAESLKTMFGLVAIGDVKAAEAYLARMRREISRDPSVPKDEEDALLAEYTASINSALAAHLSKKYFLLVASFMTKPNLLGAIEIKMITDVIANLPDSKFPPDNDEYILAEHLAQGRSKRWIQQHIPKIVPLIAKAVRNLSDTQREHAFYQGFNGLPRAIKRAMLNAAEEGSHLRKIWNAAKKEEEREPILGAAVEESGPLSSRPRRPNKSHQKRAPEKASTQGD